MALTAVGQGQDTPYARKNSFGVLTAYSLRLRSHLLLGYAENRVLLLDIGLSYSRRLLLNDFVNWQFDGEILPVALKTAIRCR